MALYIGANYHPHDWPAQRWKTDVDLMKTAGFTTVRLGHLCWDSFEPENGVYTFEWFDSVMDLFSEAGIGVVLDVSVRPAPRWVHKLCPGCEIGSKSGCVQWALTRYMEDVSDPGYQHYALRFAQVLVKRYRSHPALFAFGLCNEQGSGFMSFSEFARQRFAGWLKAKYETVEKLNKAWSSQRWSRRLSSFDDALLQENEIATGAPEAWLDMKRFFSDGVGDFLAMLKDVIEKNAPNVPHSCNHYSGHPHLGFDYLKEAGRFVDYPGIGVYPGFWPDGGKGSRWLMPVYMLRLAEGEKPMWGLEVQTGAYGMYAPPRGVGRMWIFFFLLHRAEMFLGWTFRSMLGGEEQFLFGMLDHDGTPGPLYHEYAQAAADLKKLEKYALPYLPKPEIAVAYSHDSELMTHYHPRHFRVTHRESVTRVLAVLEGQNRDYQLFDLRNLHKTYKMLIIAAQSLMEEEAIQTVRSFVHSGGTVIMTGYSGWMDHTGKVFSTFKPGGLSDVFGIRVAGFRRTSVRDYETAPRVFSQDAEPQRDWRIMQNNGQELALDIEYCENLELRGADVHLPFVESEMCAISRHSYGKGVAYYMATESCEALLQWLISDIAASAGLTDGVPAPPGVCARKIAPGQILYLNMTDNPVDIPLKEGGKGILGATEYGGMLTLAPFDVELIVKPYPSAEIG
jgi:beta-galactosidase